jgi:segregation and condensation protein A
LFPPAPPEVRTDADHIAPIRASVRDAVETILALLPSSGAIRFKDLTIGAGERLEIIVRFLAVLELFKQGVIELDQDELFGEIDVLWTGGLSPVAAGSIAIDDYEG